MPLWYGFVRYNRRLESHLSSGNRAFNGLVPNSFEALVSRKKYAFVVPSER